MSNPSVRSFFKNAGQLLVGILKKSPFAHSSSQKQPTPVSEPVDPLHAALARLARFEDMYFSNTSNGKATFTHSSETHGVEFDVSQLPGQILSFREDRDLFANLKQAGATEVDIPKDIRFHPYGAFSETRQNPPSDRKYSTSLTGTGKSSYNVYEVTKDKVGIAAVIEAYDHLISHFEYALRDSTTKPKVEPVVTVDPK